MPPNTPEVSSLGGPEVTPPTKDVNADTVPADAQEPETPLVGDFNKVMSSRDRKAADEREAAEVRQRTDEVIARQRALGYDPDAFGDETGGGL